MSKEVEFLDNQYALLGNADIIVDVGREVKNIAPLKRKPASPRVSSLGSGPDEVAYWGEHNDFPQNIINVAEHSTELPSLLDWQARALQGREIIAMQRFLNREKGDNGEWDYKPIDDPEINKFLTSITTKRYMREAALDFFWFWNVFPELIKSKSGDKIAYIGTQDASHCRWSKQDKQGNIKKCFVNANWGASGPYNAENTITFPVIDPYSSESVNEMKESDKASWIYQMSYPSPGKTYYQLSKWNGFITSGWADVARAIPNAKRSQMKRILSAKYILQIPITYWPAAYKDWHKLDQTEQLEIKKRKVKEINDQLAGDENAGKTILTEVGFGLDGKEIPGWKIIPIEKANVEGENLEDSREASEHLMRALGVDPTLVGDGPGKKMGSGSGSDKRVAFNIYVALLQPYREVILEPFYFIAEYNGWMDKYPGLVFKTLEVELETLDKSHKTSKEVVN